MNLCTNAFHAVETSNGEFEVILQTPEVPVLAGTGFRNLSPGSHIRLTVADNGIGMDSQTLGKILDLMLGVQRKNFQWKERAKPR